MFLMEVRKKERRHRLENAKRWSKELKNKLLNLIMENPIMFEKPTAQVYYKKIIAQYKEFDEYGWKAMRDKMRNLRCGYRKALSWRESTDNGIKEELDNTSAREYMLKMCEDFDVLKSIFATKSKSAPPVTLEECDSYMPSDNIDSCKETHLAYLAEACQEDNQEEHNYKRPLMEESKLKREENKKISLDQPKVICLQSENVENTNTESRLGYIAEVYSDEHNYMTRKERKLNLDERRHVIDQKIPLGWHKIEEIDSTHRSPEIADNTTNEPHLPYTAENRLEHNDYTREEHNYMSFEESKLKLEERRLALENQKIALEWHKMEENVRLRELEITNDYNLNVLRLEKEMALKELELKYKYNKE